MVGNNDLCMKPSSKHLNVMEWENVSITDEGIYIPFYLHAMRCVRFKFMDSPGLKPLLVEPPLQGAVYLSIAIEDVPCGSLL